MKRIRDGLFVILILATVAGGFLFFHFFGMEHIEDVNGPDDCSLAVITEAEITGEGTKECVGGPNTKERKSKILGITTSSGVTYSSDRFSGIYLLDSWDLLMEGDLFFDLYDYKVTGGNFLMCVVHEGQIIATVEPEEDGTVQFLLEDVEKGYYELYIAGESAAFEFMSLDFDR